MKTQMKFNITISIFATIIILMVLPLSMMGQQNRGETKQERKEREETEQLQRYKQARQLVIDKKFVVPAETIRLSDGGMIIPVQSTINFLKMDGEEVVLQVGSDFVNSSGLNNLGGFTLKGKSLNLKVKEKEKKNKLFITFTLTGVIGTAIISLSLTGSEKAMIDVNGMFSGSAFSMHGSVQSIEGVKIFEGTEF